ncbi:MAG TPA: hypothetical protein VJP79_12665 [Nitrososphaera sp.]|nr:hypothetical protein [Nitrososphaera sp.]
MVELELGAWFELASILVETAIVVLLAKTVRDYAEVAKVSRLQVKQRFRPWIGPTSGIEFLRESDGKHQFSISIKNFGEIPATKVVAMSTSTVEPPTKALLNGGNGHADKLDKYILGPLLPNMEKRYWMFVDSETMQKVKAGTTPLYTLTNFSYEFDGGTSSYGMISQYDPKTNVFVHKDMWVD